MADGKFFEIRSKLNDFVLTVDDDKAIPGQLVNLQKPKKKDGQLWYEDELTGRIRCCKDDDLVLELADDHLIVNEYHLDEYNQNWKLAGDAIRHGEDSDSVLDVMDFNKRENADVYSYSYHGDVNQQWEFEYAPRRYCYIQSRLSGRVLDIAQGVPDPGTNLVMWDMNEEDTPNQLWWEDKWGNIRSKLNDFTFHCSEPGEELYTQEYDSELVDALWAKSGKKIYNKGNPDLVLDIIGGDSDNGAKLGKWDYEGNENQHWDFIYVR